MRYAVLLFLSVILHSELHAQHIFLYMVGTPNNDIRQTFLKVLKKHGMDFTLHTGTKNLEEHLRLVSEINTRKKGLFIAVDLNKREKPGPFVAVFKPKKPDGKLLRIDEIPYVHIDLSTKIAEHIASSFGIRVVKLPLFPLLGVDMPALYLRLRENKEEMELVTKLVKEAIRKYTMKE